MKKISAISFLSWFGFCFVFCFQANAQSSSEKYLLYNGKIIDVNTGHLKKETAILIDGKFISRLGTYSSLKPEVAFGKEINLGGKYVIPGLWDMHVHLEGTDLIPDNKALLPVFLAHGITTIRDCASDLGEQVLRWRDEINDDRLIGPTIFTAGRKLEGKNSIWKDDLEIESEEELRLMLDKLDSYNVDFVKITENALDGDLFLKSVKAASARGYRVSGHVPIDLTIDELVGAGFTSIEHASYLLRLGSDERQIKDAVLKGSMSKGEASNWYFDSFDQERAIAGYEHLAQQGLFVCPTLIGGRQLAYLDEDNHQQDDFLKYLTNRFTSKYEWRIGRMANDTEDQKQERKERHQLISKQLPLMQQAGIKIIAGSDAAALNTFVYPAASLIEELEIFQQTGLKPIEILRSATLNGALYFGKESERGSIDEGKVADLLILNQNPLHDIKAVKDIFAVIGKGHYYNKEKIGDMLKKAIQTKNELDIERSK